MSSTFLTGTVHLFDILIHLVLKISKKVFHLGPCPKFQLAIFSTKKIVSLFDPYTQSKQLFFVKITSLFIFNLLLYFPVHITIMNLFRSSSAVEQLPVKQLVAGSIPASGAVSTKPSIWAVFCFTAPRSK